MTDPLDSIDLSDLDLTFEAAKPPKASKLKTTKFKEITPRWGGYHLAAPQTPPKAPARGGIIDEVIRENAALRAGEWFQAHTWAAAAIEAADRRRLGAEYRANFIQGLLAQSL